MGISVFLSLKRRNGKGDHVQAVVQVFAEIPHGYLLFQLLVRGRDDAHVELQGLLASDPPYLLFLDRAQNLRLHGEGEVADLVQKKGAAVCLLEKARVAGEGAGEGALLVAEKLAFEESFRNRGAVYGKEGVVLSRAVVVDALCEELFSRTAFSVDEHGGVGGRHLSHDGKKGVHAAVIADDIVEVKLVEKLVLEHQVVLEQLHLIHRIIHDQQELVLFQGLFEVVECAQLCRLYGGGDRAVGGHHDHVAGAVLRLYLFQYLGAFDIGQPEVRQHHLEGAVLDELKRLFPCSHVLHVKTVFGEDRLDDAPLVRVVLDDEDRSLMRPHWPAPLS